MIEIPICDAIGIKCMRMLKFIKIPFELNYIPAKLFSEAINVSNIVFSTEGILNGTIFLMYTSVHCGKRWKCILQFCNY